MPSPLSVITSLLPSALAACAVQAPLPPDAPSAATTAPEQPPPALASPVPVGVAAAPASPAAAEAGAAGVMLHSAANQAYCIDIAQDTSARRTPVRLFTCHGGENQRWVLAPDADGRTTVAGLAGQCLDVKPHAGGGANARLDPCTGAPNQQFVFDAAGRLHDQTSGKCLTVTKEARGTPILALPCDAGNPGQVWSTLER